MVLHRFGAEPCPEAPNPLVWPDREARGRMSERQYRGTVINLSAGDVTAAVDRAHGGRLASLVVGGMELLVQRPSTAPIAPLSWGCRSEEHTSELPSLLRTSYAVFCLKKQNKQQKNK